MKKSYRIAIRALSIFFVFILIFGAGKLGWFQEEKISKTNSGIESFENLSNKKIGWGLKRNSNHKQPDLGAANRSILDKYEGLCMGNESSNKVYLTFDEGYEARIHRKDFRGTKTK